MLKRAMMVALVLLTCGFAAQAQEESAGTPFKIEVQGDTMETVAFKATATRELRRQSPKSAALEFTAAFAQDGEAQEHKALRERCDVLIAEFLHRMRSRVMEDALVTKLEAGDKAEKEKQAKTSGSSLSRVSRPFVVIGEEKQADGKVLVTLERITEVTGTDDDGKTSVTLESEQQRVLCVKSGDLWAIERHESLQTDWKAERKKGEPPAKKWQVQPTLKQWFTFALSFNELEFKVENTSAEAAARGVVTQTGGFGAEFALFFYFVGKMAPAIIEVMKPLFTPESWKAAEVEAKAELEKKQKEEKERKKEEKERAIEKHEKPEEGVETFLFAPQNEWAGKHWVKMKKTDSGWKCVEARKFVRKQVYDKEGKMTESWDEKPIEKFADLDW